MTSGRSYLDDYNKDGREATPTDLPPGTIAPQALQTYEAADNSILVVQDGIPTWTPMPLDALVDHTHEVVHGSLYIHEGAVNVDISTPGQGVYVKITGWTEGHLDGVTSEDDCFVIRTPGTYAVHWSISGDSQGNNKDYEVDVFVTDAEQSEASARKLFGAAASLGNLGAPGILASLIVGDKVDLRMKETGAGAGSDFDVFNAGFFIQFGDEAEVVRS